jgi:hypothetical protein
MAKSLETSSVFVYVFVAIITITLVLIFTTVCGAALIGKILFLAQK